MKRKISLSFILLVLACVCLLEVVAEDPKLSVTYDSQGKDVFLGRKVHFDTSRSFDADGDTLYFTYQFGDNDDSDIITTTETSVSHMWASPGRYTVRVSVSDIDSALKTADGNIPPRQVFRFVVSEKADCYTFNVWSNGTNTEENLLLNTSASYKLLVQVMEGNDDTISRRDYLTRMYASIGEVPEIHISNRTVLMDNPTLTFNKEMNWWEVELSSRTFRGSALVTVTSSGSALIGCTIGDAHRTLVVVGSVSVHPFFHDPSTLATEIERTNFHPDRVIHSSDHCSSGSSLSLLRSNERGLSALIVASDSLSSSSRSIIYNLTATSHSEYGSAEEYGLNSTYSLCGNLTEEECSDLIILDVVVVRDRYLLLTSAGLFRSSSLDAPQLEGEEEEGEGSEEVETDPYTFLSFEKVTVGYAQVDGGINTDEIKNGSVSASFSRGDMCVTGLEGRAEDPVFLHIGQSDSSSSHSSSTSSLVLASYSRDHVDDWEEVFISTNTAIQHMRASSLPLLNSSDAEVTVVASAHDSIRSRDILIVRVTSPYNTYSPRHISFARNHPSGAWSGRWMFPSSFTPTGLRVGENGIGIYAYGNEVHFSLDGGVIFTRIGILRDGETTEQFLTSNHQSTFALVTDKRYVHFGRNNAAGLINAFSLEGYSRSIADRISLTLTVDRYGSFASIVLTSPLDYTNLSTNELPRGLIASRGEAVGGINSGSSVFQVKFIPSTMLFRLTDHPLYYRYTQSFVSLVPVPSMSHIVLRPVLPPSFELRRCDDREDESEGETMVGFTDEDVGQVVQWKRGESFVDGVKVISSDEANLAEDSLSFLTLEEMVSIPSPLLPENITMKAPRTPVDARTFMTQFTSSSFHSPALASRLQLRACSSDSEAEALSYGAPVYLVLDELADNEEGWVFSDVFQTVMINFGSVWVHEYINSTTVMGTIYEPPASSSASISATCPLSLSSASPSCHCFNASASQWSMVDFRTFENTASVGRQSLSVSNLDDGSGLSRLSLSSGRFYFDSDIDSKKVFALHPFGGDSAVPGPYSDWGIVVDVINATVVHVQPNGTMSEGTYAAGEWSLFPREKITRIACGSNGNSEPLSLAMSERLWGLHLPLCPYMYFNDNTGDPSVSFLDIGESLSVDAVLVMQDSSKSNDVSLKVSFSNVSVISTQGDSSRASCTEVMEQTGVDIASVCESDLDTEIDGAGLVVDPSSSQVLHVNVTQSAEHPVSISNVVITPSRSSVTCDASAIHYKIMNGCPPSKRIELRTSINNQATFLDPSGHGLDFNNGLHFFEFLPTNYRPPSHLGKAVPNTNNIYNANPTKDLLHSFFDVSKNSGKFKQCAEYTETGGVDELGRRCGCSTAQLMSPLVEDSDCIDRVERVFYQNSLKPRFDVIVEGRPNEELQYDLWLTELNNRTDFCINSDSCSSTSSTKPHLLQPGDSIAWLGDELYHFRVEATVGDQTYCDLSTEFLVYVKYPPLNSSMEAVVIGCTAMTIGLVLLVGYLGFVFKHGIRAL